MLKVQTAKAKQEAIPELGKLESNLYYIVIGEGESKVVINTGEKNYNAVKNLLEIAADPQKAKLIIDERGKKK